MDLDHTRSEGDEKRYRLLQLASGLECLLVSTKDKCVRRGDGNSKAAAAMSVQVGSFADPDLTGENFAPTIVLSILFVLLRLQLTRYIIPLGAHVLHACF